jgi:hypothetical protein
MVAERGAHPQLGCHYEGISPAIGANCQLHSDASARGGCGHRYALVGGTQREYPAFNMISYKPLRRSLAAQCNAEPERCASAGFHNNSQMVAAYRAADFCLQVRPSCIMTVSCVAYTASCNADRGVLAAGCSRAETPPHAKESSTRLLWVVFPSCSKPSPCRRALALTAPFPTLRQSLRRRVWVPLRL